jgi:hypothetical protein
MDPDEIVAIELEVKQWAVIVGALSMMGPDYGKLSLSIANQIRTEDQLRKSNAGR